MENVMISLVWHGLWFIWVDLYNFSFHPCFVIIRYRRSSFYRQMFLGYHTFTSCHSVLWKCGVRFPYKTFARPFGQWHLEQQRISSSSHVILFYQNSIFNLQTLRLLAEQRQVRSICWHPVCARLWWYAMGATGRLQGWEFLYEIHPPNAIVQYYLI